MGTAGEKALREDECGAAEDEEAETEDGGMEMLAIACDFRLRIGLVMRSRCFSSLSSRWMASVARKEKDDDSDDSAGSAEPPFVPSKEPRAAGAGAAGWGAEGNWRRSSGTCPCLGEMDVDDGVERGVAEEDAWVTMDVGENTGVECAEEDAASRLREDGAKEEREEEESTEEGLGADADSARGDS